MSEELKRYKLLYSPNTFQSTQSSKEIPVALRVAVLNVYSTAYFYTHSPARHFVSVSLPKSRLDTVRNLDGILSVTEEVKFDLD